MYILYAVYVVRVVNFSDPWTVLGRFCHLVRYLYVGISPRRVNRFLIYLLIWTQLEPYLNPCKWRFVFFQSFFEKLDRTHTLIFTNSCPVHFGYVHVRPTKKTNLAPRIGSLDSTDNEDSPHICFIGRFPYFRRSILALKVVYLSAKVIWYGTYFVL